MRCAKTLMHWYLKKTQAYPEVRRGFLNVGTDASPKDCLAEGEGSKATSVGKPGRKWLVQIAAENRSS